ncbi:MAG: type II toxin-antitoxin system RelE/ParE family toxin [Oscillospiraceae bacterium]|nr:type II toxin-antitoxin system RelE/ParE family toxin [Oscillospiraceae bacterium]MBQ3224804.1 type II toxin-antitoxin system RelE/ParE family toxin [Oscillospiraceae bacterium]MBQ4315682.1 type II toxin-antitoxin system RelE/ParE family toxin [Oscillospiraceae bacterium]MBQ7053824.1 type II toxin-antitoxin system RelE/ParE family toxin [Oscillospiraceae bacterium]
MEWKIEYIKEAQRDLKELDAYSRKLILKAIEKTALHPLPPPDGIGKALGNHSAAKLSGYYKIKLRNLGYRIVYGLVRENNVMKIIVISIRNDELVYREAERRIKKLMK